jgi:hypothetical protein
MFVALASALPPGESVKFVLPTESTRQANILAMLHTMLPLGVRNERLCPVAALGGAVTVRVVIGGLPL